MQKPRGTHMAANCTSAKRIHVHAQYIGDSPQQSWFIVKGHAFNIQHTDPWPVFYTFHTTATSQHTTPRSVFYILSHFSNLSENSPWVCALHFSHFINLSAHCPMICALFLSYITLQQPLNTQHNDLCSIFYHTSANSQNTAPWPVVYSLSHFSHLSAHSPATWVLYLIILQQPFITQPMSCVLYLFTLPQLLEYNELD